MLSINGNEIEGKIFRDGTFDLKIPQAYINRDYTCVEWFFKGDMSELALFMYVMNYVNYHRPQRLELYLPYVLDARQDRVKKPQDVFTLKAFANFINGFKFDKVKVLDVHSPVALALIDHSEDVFPRSYPFKELMTMLHEGEYDAVVYPDNGAAKKYSEIIDFPYIIATKDRDWSTRKIKGYKLEHMNPIPYRVMIVDDICSTGNTALKCAEHLKSKGVSEVDCYFTHVEHTVLSINLMLDDTVRFIYAGNYVFPGFPSYPVCLKEDGVYEKLIELRKESKQ